MGTIAPKDVMRILEITDRLGIHRESVVIPLATGGPGGARVTGAGKVEITAPEGKALEGWLEALPGTIAALDLSRVRRSG